MKIHFTKMSGAGNDFVVVDNRSGIISDPHRFSKIVCHRRYGVGADGVLLVEKSLNADFLMQYYNADGSSAGMCGNGGRCIAKFAYDNGIVSKPDFTFEAFDYIYEATRCTPNQYELKMKQPQETKLDLHITVNGKEFKGHYLNTGTDHVVLFIDENGELGSLSTIDVYKIGRTIRYHDLFHPKGTNVNFVSITGPNQLEIRTYERGVEDETLACGTGSVASALLSAKKFNWNSPVEVKVKSGESLSISFQNSGDQFTDVKLKGNAVVTFTGEFEI